MTVPPRTPGTRVRIIATNDLLGTITPLPTSTGLSGSVDGVDALVRSERAEGPTLWLDSGDLTGGPLWSLTGRRSWDIFSDLTIDAMAVGNHELDEGQGPFRTGHAKLPFPLLCADVPQLGLASSALLATQGGAIGVIGLTHPAIDHFAAAPQPQDAAHAVQCETHNLRRAGAKWIIALQHDGVDWWPQGGSIAARPDRWARSIAPWVQSVDIVLGGHTLAAWSGQVGDTTLGQADPFAVSALVVDLLDDGPHVRGFVYIADDVEVSPIRQEAADLLVRAGTQIIGHTDVSLTTAPRRPGERSLTRTVAEAVRVEVETEAALLMPNAFFTQAPIDGAIAQLGPGPVSRLDIHRLFPFPDDELTVIELVDDEFERVVAAHDHTTSPANRSGDADWWNWNRTPAGWSTTRKHPRTVAIAKFSLPLIEQWIARDLTTERRESARSTLEHWFAR
ncbi:metallophosphoesterase [Rhodococcus globerulus]|uniref:Calcineurin-like phosphoesterase domain-containing protein n=1 Tax=Rhodococcus globerulus TaxID=33008 RepID=A0ABU4C325_RHOGO|nr:metallophosphoesterase [Rhodococcus globerulus]MDV6270810.1 hypothetical protein [Rhodococcus globerulus]